MNTRILTKGLWTVDQVAEATGWKPSTVRQKVWRREIEFVRMGRSIRFRPETVEQLIIEGTVTVQNRLRTGLSSGEGLIAAVACISAIPDNSVVLECGSTFWRALKGAGRILEIARFGSKTSIPACIQTRSNGKPSTDGENGKENLRIVGSFGIAMSRVPMPGFF